MKKRHKDILISEIPNIDQNKSYGAICWMGAEFRGDLIRNVKLYEFQNMYPRIMVLLHDEEIYKIPKYIDRLRNFLDKEEILKNQLSEEDYISERTWIRSIYGILVRNREIVPGLISKYLDLIYGDIISDENKKKIIYIDTDWIFTTEEINIDVPLPIESYDIPAFYIEDKRKYIFYNGIKISHKGFHRREEDLRIISSDIIDLMRIEKIEKIGI
jgi:hypothetical protein